LDLIWGHQAFLLLVEVIVSLLLPVSNITNYSVNAGTSTLQFYTTSSGSLSLTSGGVTWYTVNFRYYVVTGETATIADALTCTNLTINPVSFAHRQNRVLVASTITITGTLTITGSGDQYPVSFQSSVLGTARSVTATSVNLSNAWF
jgi:hypothetical protein